jgi:hypothetical protein
MDRFGAPLGIEVVVSCRCLARRVTPRTTPTGFGDKLIDVPTDALSYSVMGIFEFQVILAGVTSMDDAVADALYEAGCDDGTPFSSSGVAGIGFSRAAANLEEAVRSAIRDVEQAGYEVARVESADEPLFAQINQELASQG